MTYPSYEATARSAARSPTRRVFPPKRLATALKETTDEIIERPNPPRRDRTYPRVIKRYRAHSHRIKRSTDHGQRYNSPAKNPKSSRYHANVAHWSRGRGGSRVRTRQPRSAAAVGVAWMSPTRFPLTERSNRIRRRGECESGRSDPANKHIRKRRRGGYREALLAKRSSARRGAGSSCRF